MRRLRFQVAYDGTDFSGWQVQPGLPTIQGLLEEVLSGIEGEHVTVEGSGRTDAGVHAFAQVAAVTLANPIPVDNLRRAVNRRLPPAIRISRVQETGADFHPRFQAKRKTYEYRLFREEICPPFERRFVCHYPYPLNESAMIEAAPLLAGTHDFSAFAAADDKTAHGRSKVRAIFHSRLERNGPQLVYRVTGAGFLKYMVRNMVGLLLEVGKGNVDRAGVEARLAAGNQYRPASSAPASGLILLSVEYE